MVEWAQGWTKAQRDAAEQKCKKGWDKEKEWLEEYRTVLDKDPASLQFVKEATEEIDRGTKHMKNKQEVRPQLVNQLKELVAAKKECESNAPKMYDCDIL